MKFLVMYFSAEKGAEIADAKRFAGKDTEEIKEWLKSLALL